MKKQSLHQTQGKIIQTLRYLELNHNLTMECDLSLIHKLTSVIIHIHTQGSCKLLIEPSEFCETQFGNHCQNWEMYVRGRSN
jgi:hypothetical protein